MCIRSQLPTALASNERQRACRNDRLLLIAENCPIRCSAGVELWTVKLSEWYDGVYELNGSSVAWSTSAPGPSCTTSSTPTCFEFFLAVSCERINGLGRATSALSHGHGARPVRSPAGWVLARESTNWTARESSDASPADGHLALLASIHLTPETGAWLLHRQAQKHIPAGARTPDAITCLARSISV